MEDFTRRPSRGHIRSIFLPKELRGIFSDADKFYEALSNEGFEIVHSSFPDRKLVGKDGFVSLQDISAGNSQDVEQDDEAAPNPVYVEFFFTPKSSGGSERNLSFIAKVGKLDFDDIKSTVPSPVPSGISSICTRRGS